MVASGREYQLLSLRGVFSSLFLADMFHAIGVFARGGYFCEFRFPGLFQDLFPHLASPPLVVISLPMPARPPTQVFAPVASATIINPHQRLKNLSTNMAGNFGRRRNVLPGLRKHWRLGVLSQIHGMA